MVTELHSDTFFVAFAVYPVHSSLDFVIDIAYYLVQGGTHTILNCKQFQNIRTHAQMQDLNVSVTELQWENGLFLPQHTLGRSSIKSVARADPLLVLQYNTV